MPDFGFLAACHRCPWIATDAAGEPILFSQLDAGAAAAEHVRRGPHLRTEADPLDELDAAA